MSNLPTPPSSDSPNQSQPPPAAPAPKSSATVGLALFALVAVALVAAVWMHRTANSSGAGGTGAPGVSSKATPPGGGNSGATTTTQAPATLTVATTPAGATVILDDTIIGASPIAKRPLSPGKHAVRCEREGYSPMVQVADAASGDCSLQFALAPVAYAELSVASTPTGAEVLVDGEFRGRTPTTVTKLTPGPHELLIKKDNFTTYQDRQTLHAGEKKSLSDVVLKDKLILMLQELVNTDPRMISNHLDLAHYFYINNRMAEAAREYVRCRELASLPMQVLSDDATEAEKEEVTLNYQWDKDRVQHELDKHVKSYRQYFGGNLDFDGFLQAYKDAGAVRWDIKNFDWVMSEAEHQIALGNAGRAVELFSDAGVLDPKNVTAVAGLARAEAAADNLREALPLAQRVAAQLAQKDPVKVDAKLAPAAWRYLATTDVLAAAKSPSADQPALCKSAEDALKMAEDLATANKDDYERAWVLYERAQLAGLQNDSASKLTGMTAAFAAAKANRENDKAKNNLERNEAQLEQFEMELAWAKLNGNHKDEATTLWQDLTRIADKDSAVHKRAQEILDELAQGKQPMEKAEKMEKAGR